MNSSLSNTYAGIGSRKTPKGIGMLMGSFAYVAGLNGYVLRTGGAPGADQWFEAGARLNDYLVELYLPWPGFEGRKLGKLDEPTPEAYELAKQYHPNWYGLSQGAKRLIARNGHQVLGPDLDDPVGFVVCWTPDGSLDGRGGRSGGTGQALRIAADYEIEVKNLKREDHLRDVVDITGGTTLELHT